MNMRITYVINVTTYLMCGVSMFLTALFALSFSSYERFDVSGSHYLEQYIIPALMVMVGLCIDLCKYLFWQYKTKSNRLNSLSIILMFFSWGASVTFFVSQERLNVQNDRKSTVVYQAYQLQVSSLELEINTKKVLMNKRMDSRYHAQWDKSEELMEKVRLLEAQLQSLISVENTVALQDAWQSSRSLILFNHLAQFFGASASIISTLSYALLALLIEVCALGLLDLSKYSHKIKKLISQQPTKKSHSNEKRIRLTKKEIEKKKIQVRQAILKKQFPPNMNDIKSKYNLSYHVVQIIFSELHEEGYLTRKGKQYVFVGSR